MIMLVTLATSEVYKCINPFSQTDHDDFYALLKQMWSTLPASVVRWISGQTCQDMSRWHRKEVVSTDFP